MSFCGCVYNIARNSNEWPNLWYIFWYAKDTNPATNHQINNKGGSFTWPSGAPQNPLCPFFLVDDICCTITPHSVRTGNIPALCYPSFSLPCVYNLLVSVPSQILPFNSQGNWFSDSKVPPHRSSPFLLPRLCSVTTHSWPFAMAVWHMALLPISLCLAHCFHLLLGLR